MTCLLNHQDERRPADRARTEPPIEEQEPDYDPSVKEPDYPDDPGPAEDPEEQPVKDRSFSTND